MMDSGQSGTLSTSVMKKPVDWLSIGRFDGIFLGQQQAPQCRSGRHIEGGTAGLWADKSRFICDLEKGRDEAKKRYVQRVIAKPVEGEMRTGDQWRISAKASGDGRARKLHPSP